MLGIGQGRITHNLGTFVNESLHIPDEELIEIVYNVLDTDWKNSSLRKLGTDNSGGSTRSGIFFFLKSR
jgi:hypothetical protein